MDGTVSAATGAPQLPAWSYSAPEFLFVGNDLWLDFVNTEVVADGTRVDLLGSEANLREWLIKAGIPGGWDAPHSIDSDLLSRALEFRALLRRMADGMSRGLPAPEEAIRAVNRLLRSRSGSEQLFRHGDRWRKEFRADDAGEAAPLLPIAHSAADLIAEGDPRLVRKCEGPTCILYFYDTSKNHKRRWCSMAGCGNRHKAAVHRKRIRDVEAA